MSKRRLNVMNQKNISMKNLYLVLILFFTSALSFAQQTDYSEEDGFILDGYDVTAYFQNKALEGNETFVASYDGVKFKFISKENLDKFKENPKKYIPQYGGYCAYALGSRSVKKEADPETFEIRNGKLFMFYNSWGINTHTKWLKEGPEILNSKANKAWEKLKHN